MASAEQKIEELKKVIAHQADMETLWCTNVGISEFMTQMALRHLHAIVEDEPKRALECKQTYWELESEL